MTFDVYFKASKTDSLADSIRLENVEIVKTNLNGSMIFFYNFDRQVVAQMHTDYICNIVPEATAANCAPSTESPTAKSSKDQSCIEETRCGGWCC